MHNKKGRDAAFLANMQLATGGSDREIEVLHTTPDH